MSKTSKRVTPDSDTVFGPSTADNSSGSLTHPLQGDSVPSHAIIERGVHSMSGLLDIIKSKKKAPSSYESGDVQHGMLSTTLHGIGDGIGFEGGVRGGGVSVLETLPSQPMISKKGFDEHRRNTSPSVHGVPGVEGFEDEDDDEDEGDELKGGGMSCPHGCGMVARTSHGLARHIHKKHGGFGGIGKAFHVRKRAKAGK